MHAVSSAAPGAITPGASAASGSATTLALSDHVHSVPAFGTTAGTFCQGNDGRLADDRTASGIRTATTIVALSSDTAPTIGQALIATSGTAATWQTWLTSSAPANVDNTAASAGSSATAAKSDHKHAVNTASAVSTGSANSAGSATTLALSDHVHAVPSFGAADDTSRTQTTATPTLMSGMTLTLAAGTYLVTFSGDISNSANNKPSFASIYLNGSQVAGTQRQFNAANAAQEAASFCCQAIITTPGGQAIEGRWWTTTVNTVTSAHHSITAVMVSP